MPKGNFPGQDAFSSDADPLSAILNASRPQLESKIGYENLSLRGDLPMSDGSGIFGQVLQSASHHDLQDGRTKNNIRAKFELKTEMV